MPYKYPYLVPLCLLQSSDRTGSNLAPLVPLTKVLLTAVKVVLLQDVALGINKAAAY